MTNTTWIDFLKKQNATFTGDNLLHFGSANEELLAAQSSTCLSILSDSGIISACGDDTTDFLQNQFSNDVRNVDEKHQQLNAYCSPKGRVLSLFRLFRRNDCYYLILPQERMTPTLQRLSMFVLRANVHLQNCSESMGIIGLSGPDTEQLLKRIINNVPVGVNESITENQLTVIKIGENPLRHIIVSNYSQLIETIHELLPQVRLTGPAPWAWLNTQAGLPEIFDINSDAFVPQMINLHSLQGLSFKKGCYPGQEVVARMHYLGKQKRRMYLAHIDGEAAMKPGDPLFTEQGKNEQSVGRIVSVQPAPNGGRDVLVVAQITNVENHEIILTNNGDILNFKELPYAVEVEGKNN